MSAIQARDLKPPLRNKALNKWRHVCYDDDGVDVFQCLLCKETIAIRSGLGSFCMHCGTKWNGKHEWDEEAHYEKKSLWYRRQQPEPPYRWLIEYRMTDEFWRTLGGGPEWELLHALPTRLSAKQIKEELVRQRSTYEDRTFRARLDASPKAGDNT